MWELLELQHYRSVHRSDFLTLILHLSLPDVLLAVVVVIIVADNFPRRLIPPPPHPSRAWVSARPRSAPLFSAHKQPIPETYTRHTMSVTGLAKSFKTRTNKNHFVIAGGEICGAPARMPSADGTEGSNCCAVCALNGHNFFVFLLL